MRRVRYSGGSVPRKVPGARGPAVADLALPARALAFSPVRAGAPVDDHLDVRVVLVVLGQLVEQLVGELGWDDAIDHRAQCSFEDAA